MPGIHRKLKKTTQEMKDGRNDFIHFVKKWDHTIIYTTAGAVVIVLSLAVGYAEQRINELEKPIWHEPDVTQFVPVGDATVDMPRQLFLHTSDGRDVVCTRTDDPVKAAYTCQEEGRKP